MTSTSACFGLIWPSSGNCSPFENRHTALDRKSVYFHAIVQSLLALKYVCLRTKLSLRSALFSFYGLHVCMFLLSRDIRPTSENIHTKEAQTWTPQKENNAERRESFVLKQTRFSVNNDNAIARNILT
jgi:hypothetical protein